jgi:MFS family permease
MEIKDTRQPGWFYPWAIVGILWVVAFLNYFDRNLITSMRDPIVGDFKLTDAQFGLLTSVFLWSYGILSPLGGYLADKYGRKKYYRFQRMRMVGGYLVDRFCDFLSGDAIGPGNYGR